MRFLGGLFRTLLLIAVFLGSALLAMRFAIHGREGFVPNLVGMTSQQALQKASSSGLEVIEQETFYSSATPAGAVISQSPAAGTRVRRGSHVRLAVSMGPQQAVIPDVVGESLHSADLMLRRRGLNIGSIATVSLPGIPADQVVAQSPPANAQGLAVPSIHLLVSGPEEAGPEKAWVMPEFKGMPLSEAQDAAAQIGVKIGRVVGTGTLISAQSPAAGQKVTASTVLYFEVASREVAHE
jgi:beta-lactam-binding protein with PASTA domain